MQLTLLAPSFVVIQIIFACPHVSNMYPDSLLVTRIRLGILVTEHVL